MATQSPIKALLKIPKIPSQTYWAADKQEGSKLQWQETLTLFGQVIQTYQILFFQKKYQYIKYNIDALT